MVEMTKEERKISLDGKEGMWGKQSFPVLTSPAAATRSERNPNCGQLSLHVLSMIGSESKMHIEGGDAVRGFTHRFKIHHPSYGRTDEITIQSISLFSMLYIVFQY